MSDAAANKAPLLLGVVICTLAIGGIFIFVRVITRTLIRPQFGWDDALIVITWFIVLGYNTAMFVSISHGYGKHTYDLTVEQTTAAVHAEVIGQFFAICSFPTGKASVAFLLQRIFPGKNLRWFLWSWVAANAICFYVDAILILVQCQPVAFQWDRSISGGTCWNSVIVINWGFLTGGSLSTRRIIRESGALPGLCENCNDKASKEAVASRFPSLMGFPSYFATINEPIR